MAPGAHALALTAVPRTRETSERQRNAGRAVTPGDMSLQAAGANQENLDSADDQALVHACLAGRRDAFDVLVGRHRRQVYQLCYRFVRNHEDASDLAQEAFIRAFRALSGFRGQSSVGTWLYRIAVNLCLNRVSGRAPKLESLDKHEVLDGRGQTPDAAMLREEQAVEVRAAIARLPKKQRATLILRVYHELPHDQIAAILGSSVGAVKANFFHAMANLEKILKGRPR